MVVLIQVTIMIMIIMMIMRIIMIVIMIIIILMIYVLMLWYDHHYHRLLRQLMTMRTRTMIMVKKIGQYHHNNHPFPWIYFNQKIAKVHL